MASARSVRVKLEGRGGFGAVLAAEEDAVGDLVKRACTENASFWKVVAPQVCAYLVVSGGPQPTSAVIALATSPLDIGMSLADAGVGPGA